MIYKMVWYGKEIAQNEQEGQKCIFCPFLIALRLNKLKLRMRNICKLYTFLYCSLPAMSKLFVY